MAITHGMDVAAVRALANQLRVSAGDIETMISTITAMLGSTDWLGADRIQFQTDWEGPYTAQLTAIGQALKDFATKADVHADMKESTSQS